MGTTWSARLRGADSSRAEDLHARVQEALAEVDRSMSNWKDDSEVSRFNRSTSTAPQDVSELLLEVLIAAEEIHRVSDGAFDVTVGPLVQAWGFGAGAQQEPPGEDVIQALRAKIGMDAIRIDRVAGTLQKTQPDRTLDLSAIAKGHAVDRASRALTEEGVPSHLVEVGGEIRVGGRGQGPLWKVAIEEPDPEGRRVREVLHLEHRALATSGDYRQFRLHEGRRVSHAIDPRTGQPVSNDVASVSVLADSAMKADAHATAFMVLGASESLRIAEEQGLEVQLIVRTPEGTLRVEETAGFVNARSKTAGTSGP